MIRLRPFKWEDFSQMINWLLDEQEFHKWAADKFEYPLTMEELRQYYDKYEKENDGWIMAALDEKGNLVGHFLMRAANYQKESIHLLFIVIAPECRGKGYGKQMLSAAVKYAVEILGMKKVTLKVFENNPQAHSCYQSVGFVDEKYEQEAYSYEGEEWGAYDMAFYASE